MRRLGSLDPLGHCRESFSSLLQISCSSGVYLSQPGLDLGHGWLDACDLQLAVDHEGWSGGDALAANLIQIIDLFNVSLDPGSHQCVNDPFTNGIATDTATSEDPDGYVFTVFGFFACHSPVLFCDCFLVL